jgi:peptidoglycan/xylan/chitin deacetylase (PgdA/CDA1 family)
MDKRYEADTVSRSNKVFPGSGSMIGLLKGVARTTGLRRKHVVSARMYCERNVLARTKRNRTRRGGRILCYHSINQPEAFGLNDVTPAQFKRHIDLALGWGYRFVPAAHIAATGGSDKDLAITFDDAATSVATQVQPILADYDIPWTLFAVSGWSDHATPWARENVLAWRGLEDLLNKGVAIGSHSVSHPDFGRITQEHAVDELVTSRREIERHLGFAPDVFAIPLGQSMNWTPFAHAAARETGYKIIYAQAEETRPEGTVPRTFISYYDHDAIFKALLGGAFDRWEEWV